MRDGLYRVVTPYLCAGFVVENGRVVDFAPILRDKKCRGRMWSGWIARAEWLCP